MEAKNAHTLRNEYRCKPRDYWDSHKYAEPKYSMTPEFGQLYPYAKSPQLCELGRIHKLGARIQTDLRRQEALRFK